MKRVSRKQILTLSAAAPILKTYLLVIRPPLQIQPPLTILFTAAFNCFEAYAWDNWLCICTLYNSWLINSWDKKLKRNKQNNRLKAKYNSFFLVWWKKRGAGLRPGRGAAGSGCRGVGSISLSYPGHS